MAERKTYPACFGPYLRYAIDSNFENFSTDLENFRRKFRSFDEVVFRLLLLVELKQPELVRAFEDAMKQHADKFGAEFGPDVGHTKYATLRCHKAAVIDDVSVPIWTKFVSRVELSLPVQPSTPKQFKPKFELDHRYDEGSYPPGSLLIGMLDDGCPFAAAQFLNISATGGVSTRVRGSGIRTRISSRLPSLDVISGRS
jgi:hypothetical protein